MLETGRFTNAQDSNGQTALHLALFMDSRALEILLGDTGVDVNSQDNFGMTALMSCCQNLFFMRPGDKVIYMRPLQFSNALLLAKHNPNLSLVDEKNRTPLHFLCLKVVTRESFSLIKVLVASGASLRVRDDSGLSPFERLFSTCIDPRSSALVRHADEFHRLEVNLPLTMRRIA